MTARPAADAALLHEQYSDTSRLRTRIEAHRSFSERSDSFVAWVIDGLALRPGDLVLDAGCGYGACFDELRRRGARIVGIDRSAAMVEKASQSEGDGAPLGLGVADLQSLPIADGAVDRVLANYVLFHVPDLELALQEIRRVLKPGGRAVLTTNASDSQAVLIELHRQAARAAGYAPRPRRTLRFTELDEPLVASEFAQCRLDTWDDAFLFPTVPDALRYYATGPIDAIADRPADDSHRAAITAKISDLIRREIDRHGVLRVPKSAIRYTVRR
ncbi:MAG: class I SAM-dependent methyltransferase [Chloroflexi bacterium]|nr:class I SAM-dependent methyltransferase [Chloroflexota bacterium]